MEAKMAKISSRDMNFIVVFKSKICCISCVQNIKYTIFSLNSRSGSTYIEVDVSFRISTRFALTMF